ncbi:GntR family transcriptional regulator, partial [Frankia sp. CiP1_Cm_nod1]
MVLLNATNIATDGPGGIGGPGGLRTSDPSAGPPPGGRGDDPGRSPAGEGHVGRRVRVPKTAELVAARLRRQIVRGELVEGDALPPEAVLMEQFGVSRPTLREAFRVLESEALISVRRGAHGGARVHTPNGDVAARYAALVLEYRGTTIADVHQARALLEPPCVRRLAQRHTEEDLARLRAALAAV